MNCAISQPPRGQESPACCTLSARSSVVTHTSTQHSWDKDVGGPQTPVSMRQARGLREGQAGRRFSACVMMGGHRGQGDSWRDCRKGSAGILRAELMPPDQGRD